MIKKTFISFAVTLCLTSTLTHAQDSPRDGRSYYGIGYSKVTYTDDTLTDDLSFSVVQARLGRSLNQIFSLELRAGVGVGDDTATLHDRSSRSEFDMDFELDYLYGAYIRGGVRISDMLYPYAVLGYTRSTLTASAPNGRSVSATDDDTSFGFGVDVDISPRFTLNVEYINYFDKYDTKIDGIAVGLLGRF